MGLNIILLQAFNEFDVDGGGNISTKELGWAMRAMGMNPTENALLELINEVSNIRQHCLSCVHDFLQLTSFHIQFC